MNFKKPWVLYLKCESTVRKIKLLGCFMMGKFAVLLVICPRKYCLISSAGAQLLGK